MPPDKRSSPLRHLSNPRLRRLLGSIGFVATSRTVGDVVALNFGSETDDVSSDFREKVINLSCE